MSPPTADARPHAPRSDGGERARRRARRAVLAGLAVSALVIAGAGAGPARRGGGADPRFPAAAVGLAVASIAVRRAAEASARPARVRLQLEILGLLLAGALGPLAVALRWATGAREAALLYALGGALLALRSPLLSRRWGR